MMKKTLQCSLYTFSKIESASLSPIRVEKSKEEKACEITCQQIVCTAKNLEPIKVTYLSNSGNDSPELASKASSGTAVKMDTNTWHACLENKTFMTATDKDLMDENKYFVKCKWMNCDSNEIAKKKQSAKLKCAQKAEKAQQVKIICEQDLQKRQELELAEYNKLCKTLESGQPYRFEQFLEMVDLLRKPFVCQIEGHEVSLTQEDCTIMMESSAIHA